MYYVIVAIAVLIAVYIKFVMYKSKKNKDKAKKKYQEMRDHLEDILQTEVRKYEDEAAGIPEQSSVIASDESCSLNFEEQYPFVSDLDDGYLVSLDRNNRKIAITSEQGAGIYDFSEIVSCSVDVHWLPDDQAAVQEGRRHQGGRHQGGRRLSKIMPLRKEQALFYDEVIINIFIERVNQDKDAVRIVLGSKQTKRSSMMGQFILHTAEQVEALINDIAGNDNKNNEGIGEKGDGGYSTFFLFFPYFSIRIDNQPVTLDMRQTRKLRDGAIYHVTARANRQELIFDRVCVKEMMLKVLKDAREKYRFKVVNFCIMGNHIHLMIKPLEGENLSKIMQWMLSVFARRFNSFYKYRGHVWYDRFKSKIVRTFSQYINTFRYIAMNPVKAGLVKSASEYVYNGVYFLKKSMFDIIEPPNILVRKSFPEFC